jgi:hypothetical protein
MTLHWMKKFFLTQKTLVQSINTKTNIVIMYRCFFLIGLLVSAVVHSSNIGNEQQQPAAASLYGRIDTCSG